MEHEETAEQATPLVAKLREQEEETRAKLAEATGDDVWHLARELAVVEERRLAAESGRPVCRNCGSDAIVAWYLVDERQGIDIERAEDGSLEYDYDGDTSSGEPGADYEYRCRGCDMAARSLAYLVGDEDEDEPDDPTIEELQKACEYDPEGEGTVDALIAYKDALEDAYEVLRAKART